jgi:hypothetical protein
MRTGTNDRVKRTAGKGFVKDLSDGTARERAFAELLLKASIDVLRVAPGRGLKPTVENTFITWRLYPRGQRRPSFHAIEWDADFWVVLPAWRVRSLGDRWQGRGLVIPLNRIFDRVDMDGHLALLSGIDVPNPPKWRDRKKYDMALRPENVVQGTFSQLLFKTGTDKLKIEHKTDKRAMTTGNLFVEYECRGESSGIDKTEAHIYAVEWDRECWLVLPTQRLRRIATRGPLPRTDGGDFNSADAVLVCLDRIFDPI